MPAANGSISNHAYFKALEAAFIRLRGAPLLLSPADWQVAKGWRNEGIPLELVVRVMERIFERQAETGNKAGIRSLRYFKTAVGRSWHRVLELGGGGREEVGDEPLDVSARLVRLVAALPTQEFLREASGDPARALRRAASAATALEGVAEGISSLSGSTQEVEAALQRLDRSMMDRLLEGLDSEALAEVMGSAEESLAELSGRLTPEDRARTLALLVRRRLRQELGLPVLSLFSREAAAPETG